MSIGSSPTLTSASFSFVSRSTTATKASREQATYARLRAMSTATPAGSSPPGISTPTGQPYASQARLRYAHCRRSPGSGDGAIFVTRKVMPSCSTSAPTPGTSPSPSRSSYPDVFHTKRRCPSAMSARSLLALGVDGDDEPHQRPVVLLLDGQLGVEAACALLEHLDRTAAPLARRVVDDLDVDRAPFAGCDAHRERLRRPAADRALERLADDLVERGLRALAERVGGGDVEVDLGRGGPAQGQ